MTVKHIKNQNELNKALNSKKSVVVFGSDFCIYCMQMKEVLTEMDNLYADTQFYFVKIDDFNPYNLQSIPLTIVIRDKKEVARIEGANLDKIIQNLK